MVLVGTEGNRNLTVTKLVEGCAFPCSFLPAIVRKLDRTEALDESGERSPGGDLTRSSHTFVSRNRACLQGEVGPRERT